MPTLLYSRVPAAALRTEIDGNVYAYIPHRLSDDIARIIEDFATPRMVRFGAESFIRAGEAYVYFAKLGDALPVPLLPFGVSSEQRNTDGRATVAPACR